MLGVRCLGRLGKSHNPSSCVCSAVAFDGLRAAARSVFSAFCACIGSHTVPAIPWSSTVISHRLSRPRTPIDCAVLLHAPTMLSVAACGFRDQCMKCRPPGAPAGAWPHTPWHHCEAFCGATVWSSVRSCALACQLQAILPRDQDIR